MKIRPPLVFPLLLVVVGSSGWLSSPTRALPTQTLTTCSEGNRMLGGLPVAFVPNLGQWETTARYVARFGAMTMCLEDRGWSFTLVEQVPRTCATRRALWEEEPAEDPGRGVAVRMAFVGANATEPIAEMRLPGLHHYFLGNDPAKWRHDVPLFGSVHWPSVYEGIDVCARVHDGRFEYDLLLAPDADLAAVEMRVEGGERLHVAANGDLVMTTALGPVHMPVPVSWEEGPAGERMPIGCEYVLRDKDRFGIAAPQRRSGWAMVVDPGLVWSTFLGGQGNESWGQAVAIDDQGYAYVTGATLTPNFGAPDVPVGSAAE